ncbi:MAG: hypothetical protein J6B98_00545 [Bacilli bacterium]|nr:hypothetical protein [Bacilli bacterium]
MTEENRKNIINEIQKKLIDIEVLENKRKELIELSKDPNVAKYIALMDDIKRVEYDISEFEKVKFVSDDIVEKIIYKTFKTYSPSLNCDHNVMIYNGTYVTHKHPMFLNSRIYSSPEKDNSDIHRLYNYYTCLECGTTIQIPMKDVNQFEISHTVLKQYDEENIVQKCQNLYYNLLYNNIDSLDAQKQICEQFQKDSEKTLIKKRKN